MTHFQFCTFPQVCILYTNQQKPFSDMGSVKVMAFCPSDVGHFYVYVFLKVLFRHTHDSDWESRSTHAVLALPGKALLTLSQQVFSGSTLFTVFLVSSVIVTKSRLCVYVLLRELHTGSEKERCLFCLLKEECLYHKLEPDFGEICMYCC